MIPVVKIGYNKIIYDDGDNWVIMGEDKKKNFFTTQ